MVSMCLTLKLWDWLNIRSLCGLELLAAAPPMRSAVKSGGLHGVSHFQLLEGQVSNLGCCGDLLMVEPSDDPPPEIAFRTR